MRVSVYIYFNVAPVTKNITKYKNFFFQDDDLHRRFVGTNCQLLYYLLFY